MRLTDFKAAGDEALVSTSAVRGIPAPRGFLRLKRLLDVLAAIAILPHLLLISAVLVLLNPIFNPGPLIYTQLRMGRGCRPFRILKFRTMTAAPVIERGPWDPLETHRITRLGRFLRRSRIDELPQFVNVLMGQMSLIGPRPDYWDHACHYVGAIPGYRRRHAVRPGITGLAQVDGGYAAGHDAVINKTEQDLRYIESTGYRTEWYIVRRTIAVILTGFGAK